MLSWRPGFELNIEGYPDERFFNIVEAARSERCTLVADGADVLTSDEGWKLGVRHAPTVRAAAVAAYKAALIGKSASLTSTVRLSIV